MPLKNRVPQKNVALLKPPQNLGSNLCDETAKSARVEWRLNGMKEHLMLRQIDDAALPSRRVALASIPRPPTNGEKQPRHARRTGMDGWMEGGNRLAEDDAHASNDAPEQRLRTGSLAEIYARFTMASSSSPWLCLSPSVSNDVLAFIPRSSAHLHQHQTRVLLRISCKAEDTIGSKRRGRRGGRKDPMMDEREVMWPYLETQERMIVDLNKQILVDTENLLHRANNKFGLVLEIAEEANEYLRNNKDEALTKKPILKVMSDRINEAAGENIRNAYCEETLDPQE